MLLWPEPQGTWATNLGGLLRVVMNRGSTRPEGGIPARKGSHEFLGAVEGQPLPLPVLHLRTSCSGVLQYTRASQYQRRGLPEAVLPALWELLAPLGYNRSRQAR